MVLRIKADLAQCLESAIVAAQSAGDLPPFEQPESEVEQPREPRHGDLAAPIALRLARSVPHPPLDIAHAIARHLSLPTYISGVAVAPPGFINFRLQDSFLQQQVDAILREGDAYGNLNLGQGKRVQVEFVSANPTGPLTVGRGRGGVIGDTLARALAAAGYQVQREYYYNDAGRQIDLLGESLQIRCRQLLGRPATLGEDHYKGEYLYWLAATLVAEHGDVLLDEPLRLARLRFYRAAKQLLARTLHLMGMTAPEVM